uniref:Uncharacterized protein n=1 Tax=Ciona intestinalis TaxID=7719 RepID=H2XPQ7_CIOIN
NAFSWHIWTWRLTIYLFKLKPNNEGADAPTSFKGQEIKTNCRKIYSSQCKF